MLPIVNEIDSLHLRLKQSLTTVKARPKCRIDNRSFDGVTEPSGGDHGVLFGMDAYADVVSHVGGKSMLVFAEHAATIVAVCQPLRSTIVAGRDDSIFLYDDG